MEGLVRGDIVVIPFPFSDLSATKRRPALVLAILGKEDVLLCQITSRNRLDSTAIELRVQDFSSGGLSVSSFVRCGKLFAASTRIIEKRVGVLHPAALAAIAERNANIILGSPE
ncbi:MAG: type II toxin-antitoxin system PemK/MazF family toxin [Spirochaetota bacterium]